MTHGPTTASRISPRLLTIDVHHHFQPSGQDSEGRPWSAQSTLDALDVSAISAAVGSLPPVPAVGPDGGRALAREWNEWAARLVGDHRDRFGLFACLPLGDVDAALAEIAHAYDALHTDGIGIPTNHGDVWLCDARFDPLWEEMDRRRAVVLLHPYPTSRCIPIGHEYGGEIVSPPWLEFPTNTARVILGFLLRGVARRFPGIRFVFCHGGGTMPVLLGRIAGFAGWSTVGPDKLRELFPDGIHAEFGKFYFECAQTYAPELFGFLQTIIPPGHLLFGSDHSYVALAHSTAQFEALDLPPAFRASVAGENAAALFPRFLEEKA